MSLQIGHVLGQYKILDHLGAGGMGVVYKAQDLRLGRFVALKVLPPSTSRDVEAVERFRREARTASSLNHPNICTIYSFDEQDQQMYLAMELLQGSTLDKVIGGKPLALPQIIELGSQVADALDAAHREGILHRDIKPANIFLTERGPVKVLDFGLAKLTPGAGRHVQGNDTQPSDHFTSIVGTTVGTIAYMSPEQARGEALDPRTDLFSFGVMLYEMATGHQSFPGATTAVVFDGILNRDPTPPSAINPAVPPELDRIIEKALEKDRSLRYQSAADLRADLQRLKRSSGSRRMTAVRKDDIETALPGQYTADMFTSAAAASHASAAAASAASAIPASRMDVSAASAIPGAAAAGAPAAGGDAHAASAVPAAGHTRLSPRALGGTALAIVVLVAATAAWYLTREPALESAVDLPETLLAENVGGDSTLANPVSPDVPSLVAPPTPAGSASSAPATTTKTAAVPPAAAAPVPVAAVKPAVPDKAALAEAEARQRLDIARAKISNNLLDPALADLHRIVVDFAETPAAADAALLSAEVLEKASRLDEAMAAHVEFEQRFPRHARLAGSKLRLAELTLKSRRNNREQAARAIFTDVVTRWPGSPEAFAALQTKLRLEQGIRQRELDPVLGRQVPAVLPSLRAMSEQFPTRPQTMSALNRLAELYEDLQLYEQAAQAYTLLATNFPSNPHDAWYRAGEVYERRLKDADRARDAYTRVPEQSNRYRDAQRKLTRK